MGTWFDSLNFANSITATSFNTAKGKNSRTVSTIRTNLSIFKYGIADRSLAC